MTTIKQATADDLAEIQLLAEKTWPVAYADVITAAQIRYMLDKMYSLPALQEQLKNGHQFLLAQDENTNVGFAAFELNYEKSNKTKLHKLYVLPLEQGKNIGRILTEKVAEIARAENQNSIILNVNRNNKAKDFYSKLGFEIIKTVDLNIGEGFYMNDYIMKLIL